MVGKRDTGVICLNGPAAHLLEVGEEVVIMGFELSDRRREPKIILVDERNKFIRYLLNNDQENAKRQSG